MPELSNNECRSLCEMTLELISLASSVLISLI